MAYKILNIVLQFSDSNEHFLANDSTTFNHLSLRVSFGSNISFNCASAIKGGLRMWFFIPLLNNIHIISTLNQLTINHRSKSIENKYWKQINVKMTDESLSDCTNSAYAIGLVMIIFHSLRQIFWPSFAFCGIKQKWVWVINSWQHDWHSECCFFNTLTPVWKKQTIRGRHNQGK